MSAIENDASKKDGRIPRGSGRPSDLTSSDPYIVLGLKRGVSSSQVKRAYFAMVREYPPEQNPEAFKIIRAAYEKLRTGKAKAETDLFLFRPPYPWEARKRKQNYDLEVHAEDVFKLLEQHGDLGRTDFNQDFRGVPL